MISIVGNGSSPEGKGWGETIDSGLVVRMHNPEWQNPKDYGTRTDYAVVPGPWGAVSVLESTKRTPDIAWLCYHFGLARHRTKHIPSQWNGKPVLQFDLHGTVERMKPFVPTRGLSAVLMAVELGFGEIRLVGFDSVWNGYVTRYAKGAGVLNEEYLLGKTAGTRHNYQFEKDVLNNQEANGISFTCGFPNKVYQEVAC